MNMVQQLEFYAESKEERIIILAGVTIGENSVIGAGSVVTRSIPANCVAVGSPCKVIKRFEDECERGSVYGV